MASDNPNICPNKNELNENEESVLEDKKYELVKDDKLYEINICKMKDKIYLKHFYYEIKLNAEELSQIFKIILSSIDEAYKYITNIFNKNKVKIKEILNEDKIKLIINIYDEINENTKEIEIDLIHNTKNKDYIIIDYVNKYNNLEKEVILLKNEFIILKEKVMKSINQKNKNNKKNDDEEKNIENQKEINNQNEIKTNENKELAENSKDKNEANNNNIDNIKNINENNNINNKISDEKKKIEENENRKSIDLHLLNEITENSFCSNIEDNTFCIFNSFQEKILYLIYSTKSKSIICYNFSEKKITNEIKNPHDNEYITNYRHCIYNNKDIIMSISLSNNMIKIWEFPDFSCILTLKNVYSNGNLYSACFLNNDDNININERYNYIITSCAGSNEPIKIFDFNGDIIKKFEQKNFEDIYFIDSYFDINLKIYYIITGNYNYVKSYDFYETKLYKQYSESLEHNYGSHCSCAVYVNKNENSDIVKLIDLCYGNENIYIWNFHSSELIYKINTNGVGLVSCCLWDQHYFYVGCRDRTIKLIDISKREVIQSLTGHKNWISCIKKIKHPEYGECLISQGDLNDQIKLWVEKNILNNDTN